jgi:DNA-binding beta-propeller fold protein YncE
MGVVSGIVAAAMLLPILFGINRGLNTPESAQCYQGKLYISNIGKGPPHSKDGDGYITLADLKGNIVKTKFITGLNAPKGIAFAGNKLFVTDIDTVVVANAKTGKVLKKIPVPGAKFLNDAAYDGKRTIYVTDTQTNSIYAIDTQKLTVSLYMKDSRLQGPNGIAFFPDGRMLIASWGGGKLFLFDGKELKVIASGFETLDGVVVLKDGTIAFSDFSTGKVYELKDGKVKEIYRG